MSLKKVVIVEDEKWILRGIERLFKWEQYGFCVDFMTTSPNEAFEYIKDNKPDVLFTDIKMREMTGLELIARLKAEGIEPLCIIISGYDNFEYMHSAIRLRVFDYCLKPLSEVAAEEILRNLSLCFSEENRDMAEDSSNRFNEVISFINSNYGEKISLQEISEKFYFNMNYLSYALKKRFGMTLTDYLRKLRMENARELIRGGKSIAETAVMVGMPDYAHFHKAYKKYWGVTPKEDAKCHEEN